MRILLDMDEVLVDFVKGAAEAWGLTKAEVEAHWEPGKWDMLPPLGKALGEIDPRYGPPHLPLGRDEFWDRLNGSEAFWLNLEPTPWCDELWKLCNELSDDVHIVSAPSRCESSYSGKVKWLKRKFGTRFDRFALTPHKEIFAGPNVLLLDDRDENVDAFWRVGGIAWVFPRLHNRLHLVRDEAFAYIQSRFNVTFNRKEQPNGV